MTSPSIDFAPIRFSTDDLSQHDRLAHWREVSGRTIMKMDMEPLGDEPFRCSAALRMLPGLAIAALKSTPNRLTRTRGLVADGNDDLVLAIPTHGATMISAHSREATLQRGDATLFSSADPSSSIIPMTSSFLSLAIPVARLAPLISNLDAALGSAIPANVEALRLLVGYLESLQADMALSSPELSRLVVKQVYDLVALAIGPTRDAAEIAGGRGVRAARLRAIQSDIATNAATQSFSIEGLAARHRISPRYIRRLFEGTGTTVIEFVVAQRLAHAHRMLSDAQYDERTISSIAFDAGFSDLSYFNRCFRQRYGATPSDIRAGVRPTDMT
ncbi:helix-turn-helix domain-containing protein [Bradyrhizobium sp. CCGUVB1N3]|uniref:helix-turn-helix domain-containing protein n=1 Tax=Bradyrhizobium sp. CCGUVB1N3 TaxID=2949629 RepID=UPI0020B1F55E|nr:helix-turn-helix domain-containing protein [Bradyrhizobium sp. CCGUVB1N3]MCP3473910.1 helix-turn-helix domain-containing protein [Bradyrhizobium sp. CCGUVB1N3]